MCRNWERERERLLRAVLQLDTAYTQNYHGLGKFCPCILYILSHTHPNPSVYTHIHTNQQTNTHTHTKTKFLAFSNSIPARPAQDEAGFERPGPGREAPPPTSLSLSLFASLARRGRLPARLPRPGRAEAAVVLLRGASVSPKVWREGGGRRRRGGGAIGGARRLRRQAELGTSVCWTAGERGGEIYWSRGQEGEREREGLAAVLLLLWGGVRECGATHTRQQWLHKTRHRIRHVYMTHTGREPGCCCCCCC